MELPSELSPVDKARLFWSTQDLDSVFCEIQNHLNQLQTRLQTHTASDKDMVQSLKLLEAFDWPFVTTPPVVQVVIGSDAEPSTAPPALLSSSASVCEDHQAPIAPVEYQEHFCSESCVPTLPSMPESQLWLVNPLRVPLIYGFHRSNPEDDQSEQSVVYTAPCGIRLCNHDDVMDFLLMSESFHLLQLDLFSFSSCVSVNPGLDPSPSPGLDLSRGQELTPVELCVSEGERPPVFKYRRDRWPRGCFLSKTDDLYRFFCDCRGQCGPGTSVGEEPGAKGACPCVSMTTGHGYQHGRLQQPNNNGIFECGPWCGCDPGLCQNRVVQRGLRVRLQVYRTQTSPDPSPDLHQEPNPDSMPDQRLNRGWGVRCKDDLDQGTFICVYAGLVLQKGVGSSEAPPLKQRKAELPTDDEIQLVTEWLPNTAPNTDPAHVPVIQRGSDVTDQASVNGSKRSLDQNQTRARTVKSADFYLIDASQEGNASRFFNHSCDPTLFVQNVFTDSHDRKFPHVAFFTKRALKAGTELTWDYNSAPSQDDANDGGQEMEEGIQEVPCLCRSDACRQHFHVTELKKVS